MTKDRKPKVPKINIPDVDLKTFLLKDMKIDPFWNDLLYDGKKNTKKKKET